MIDRYTGAQRQIDGYLYCTTRLTSTLSRKPSTTYLPHSLFSLTLPQTVGGGGPFTYGTLLISERRNPNTVSIVISGGFGLTVHRLTQNHCSLLPQDSVA